MYKRGKRYVQNVQDSRDIVQDWAQDLPANVNCTGMNSRLYQIVDTLVFCLYCTGLDLKCQGLVTFMMFIFYFGVINMLLLTYKDTNKFI